MTARTGSASNIVITNAGASAGNGLFRRSSRRSTIADEMEREKHRGGVEFDDAVDVIVVDNDFEDVTANGMATPPNHSEAGTERQPSQLASQLKAKTGTSVSHAFDHPSERSGRLESFSPYAFLRWRVWPLIHHFFDPAFADMDKEEAYQREHWFTAKPTSLATSLAFLVIWACIFGLQPHPVLVYTKYTYGVAAALLIAPLFPLVALDFPRKAHWIWQIVLWFASWCLPTFAVFDMWHCGFYTAHPNCGNKDFIGVLFYPTALPVLALLLLGQSRIVHAFGVLWYIVRLSILTYFLPTQNTDVQVIVSVLLVPAKTTWVRNVVNEIIFHLAVLWGSYLRGQASRRMFTMRDQLKQQYKATQKAQVAERAAAESKRKFVSYIFHEARVPLNTALIALQNMEGEHVFDNIPVDSKELVAALSSSLVLMEKVLNDVLDFNRMEAGRLIIQNRPFELHAVFRAVALAFRGAADARKITLISDLDPNIDEFCPVVCGDETRLLQILSNLLSNACKFTAQGTVRYATRLLYPTTPSDAAMARARRASATGLVDGERPRRDVVVIRIEVEDSGAGIRRKDLEDKTMRLFSPYIQTEIGQRQGGKGSGLGLALVRQIVKLSGGRLGVISRLGSGSKFWAELSFGLPGVDSPQISAMTTMRPFDALTDTTRPGAGRAEIPGEPQSRADLVAAQIPVVTDLEGLPVVNLPLPTPLAETPGTEDPYKMLSCLVVDDDALTRKLMARMLTRLGHNVSVAENGMVALNMLREAHMGGYEFKWQVVFLDNQMPLMSGVEVVREVRRLGMRTFVVGLTGNALRDDQDEYREAGLSMLLTKPLLERQLRHTIDEARDHLRSIEGR